MKNKMSEKLKSKCCDAEIAIKTAIDYPCKSVNEMSGKNTYFVCKKCSKRCELKE